MALADGMVFKTCSMISQGIFQGFTRSCMFSTTSSTVSTTVSSPHVLLLDPVCLSVVCGSIFKSPGSFSALFHVLWHSFQRLTGFPEDPVWLKPARWNSRALMAHGTI